MWVECLCGESLRLRQYVVVQVGQYRRVEAYVVLHKQYHLHSGLAYVVLNVHLVLEQLYYRHDEVGVAQPAEDIVEHRHVLVFNALGYAV